MINKVIINGVLETKELKIYGKAFKKAYIKIATTKKHSKKIIIVEGIIYERLIKKIIINEAFNLLKNSVCCYSGYLSVDKKGKTIFIIDDISFIAKGREILGARKNT